MVIDKDALQAQGWLDPEQASDLRALVADMRDNRVSDAETEALRQLLDKSAELIDALIRAFAELSRAVDAAKEKQNG